jgi:predicted dehydrogenase
VIAQAFVSPRLAAKGVDDLSDELRVMIVDESQTSSYFTFSSRMRPVLHQVRVYGSRNALILDEYQQTVVKLRGAAFKSYAERFIPPMLFARQYTANAASNARAFLASDFHMDAGKKNLMAAFYQSIIEGTPVPIPYGEILATARVMDAIFEQVGARAGAVSRERSVPC